MNAAPGFRKQTLVQAIMSTRPKSKTEAASAAILITKKRKSGIPTGHAGEYFVMGELLRRGYDAQLADRNTKGYDMLVGRPRDKTLQKVQVKTVRAAPWYVKTASFEGALRSQITIYVLLGNEDGRKPVRYFITRNSRLAKKIHRPKNWQHNAFMPLKSVEKYENKWSIL